MCSIHVCGVEIRRDRPCQKSVFSRNQLGKIAFLGGLLLVGCATQIATQDNEPNARIGNPEDRLAKPLLPSNPSQADNGAIEYWLVCMVCHGDRGQGLTDEWRSASGPEDQDCWQSKCHASNYPPGGFELPHFIPSIIGENTLLRFSNAQELYEYIAFQMPWWSPGLLTEEQNWLITAYVLQENGIILEVDLNADNARSILIH
ncbi:MAG: hypothetical protein FVQ83_02710 [Chloroflexi bacterium]|nr:hypothetical protein [Chloroflexota bacterium]